MVGLSNVDNTSDANKPVSTAQQAALDLKAPLANPTTFTSRTSAADNSWHSVAYGNGLWVAVATSGTGNRVMTSPDGINWTIRTSAADNSWFFVAYGNGLWVAVATSGTGNRVMTSPDGINWTIRTSAADNSWRSVAYGNGLWVAVAISGTGNRVMTSPDGINWTLRTSATDNDWSSVAYGNGLWVAVAISGTGNRVMTSPDGINWTIGTSAANNNWRSVVYGNGLWVAVAYSGAGNRVMTSPDGINWTIRTSAADNDWFSVAYGNGLWVAVGVSGSVMTSPDGINWTLRTSAANNTWRSVSYGNGVWVAVSSDGTNNRVMTSGFVFSETGISKGMVGLSNVDNTSDADKPVSTAQQTALNLQQDALDLKAPLANPTFTGVVDITDASLQVIRGLNERFTQVGSDIDGEAVSDQSGYSVSISADGSVVAIGATGNDGNGNNSGHVRVYEYNGTSWVQRGQDIDGEAAGDQSGFSVSISADGSVVAIGATSNANYRGHVRVYEWINSSWVQRGQDIDGEAAGDFSGCSVSISADGSVVAIGAIANNNYRGHVRVYHWNNSSWVQRGADIDGEAAEDRSGYSVSISADGSVVAIGATNNDDGNNNYSGHVRVYEWINSSWVQRGQDIDGEAAADNAAADNSGHSVSISADGTTVAIGAPYNEYKGHVRVYDWINSSWVQRGTDIDGEAAGDYSGWSVSISADGSTVAIGAYRNNNSYRGHVRVYEWINSSWVQRGADIDGEAAGDYSGYSVSISADGTTVAIGATFNTNNRGHVRVYEYELVCSLTSMELSYLKNTSSNIQTQIDLKAPLVIPEFSNDVTAGEGGIPLFGLYRTYVDGAWTLKMRTT
jgi:hypothetical protein